MESHGQGSDPASERAQPEPETGLEEPMWQLGLGGDGESAESYPERPGEADCTHYIRTGYCGYGPRCRFNHPPDRSVVGVTRAARGEFPERMGEPGCQYYMRTGMCKFGASCKYDHPRQGGGSVIPIATNIYGYPLRPGEKECSYYVKSGQCKFRLTCKFDHPQPAGIQVQVSPGGPPPIVTSVPSAIYPTLQSLQAISSDHYAVVTGAYGPMLLPQGMFSLSSWNPHQTHVTSTYMGAYLASPSTTVPSSSSPKEKKFPERPGEAECQYYMKTGDCKFGSACRYHHPPQLSFTISPMGYPLRPGAPLCAHYAQSGMCKFGEACKFDHPIATPDYSHSALSSSSSGFKGSEKDIISTNMPSSITTPSGSVGSILFKSEPNTSQEGDAYTSS